jgi:DNA-binding response OmpR family regulator
MRVLPLFKRDGAMHVLIIEDEPLIAMSIEDILRECGATSFDFASTFAGALAAAKERCPSLITADVQLAPGNGIDAVAAICKTKTLPVIFVTGTADEVEDRHPEAIIVHKPFDPSVVKEAVARAMGTGQ